MADGPDDPVRHLLLLREIGTEGQDMRADRGQRMRRLDRKIYGPREANMAALGRAGLAKASSGHHGATIDAPRREREERGARVAALENRT